MKGQEKFVEDLLPIDVARIIDAYLNDDNDYFFHYSFDLFRDAWIENVALEEIRARAETIVEYPENYIGYNRNSSKENYYNEAARPKLEELMAELYAMDDDFNLNTKSTENTDEEGKN